MDYLKAIDRRCSRRKYMKKEIPEELVSRLNSSIESYNAESGLNMQLILHDGNAFGGLNPTYGIFTGVENYIALIGKKGDEHRMEKEGYFGEKLVLEATDMGLSTCWIGTSYRRDKCTCAVAADETLDLVIAIGYSEEKRSFKENMMDNMMHKNSKRLEDIMICKETPPSWFKSGMDAVSKAPTARNLMPFIFTYEDDRATISTNGDAERVMVDIGIAKLHFELGAGCGKWPPGDHVYFEKL